jgi:Protein of unknown function (DUF5661)
VACLSRVSPPDLSEEQGKGRRVTAEPAASLVSVILPAMGFTEDEARRIGEQIGIDWATAPFDVDQFRRGMDVELEHGAHDPATNVTGDDPVVTGKIALAHLNEFADYYTRLERMEEDAKRELGSQS